jgi:hypothetical protein
MTILIAPATSKDSNLQYECYEFATNTTRVSQSYYELQYHSVQSIIGATDRRRPGLMPGAAALSVVGGAMMVMTAQLVESDGAVII